MPYDSSNIKVEITVNDGQTNIQVVERREFVITAVGEAVGESASRAVERVQAALERS